MNWYHLRAHIVANYLNPLVFFSPMKTPPKKFVSLFIRYLLLVAVAIPNLWIFSIILTPLTVYLTYFSLNLFFSSTLQGNIISISGNLIRIIEPCVAGSAYYLLLILNLSTPNIKLKKRIKIIALSFASLLIINVLRIFFLSYLYLSGSLWFDFAHKAFWYTTSIFLVIAIWFTEVKIFKIKEIPFYSDIKFLLKSR